MLHVICDFLTEDVLAFILYIQRYAVTETDVKFNGNEKLINIRAV